MTDPLRRHFRLVCRPSGTQWLQRTMVHLHLPLSHPVFLHHSHLVSSLLLMGTLD